MMIWTQTQAMCVEYNMSIKDYGQDKKVNGTLGQLRHAPLVIFGCFEIC